ncbi:MAG: hypothetical protein JWQ44_318 [Chthoniobacter sp.]|nr:hypothetical protein [Chthoniobacter sp.]
MELLTGEIKSLPGSAELAAELPNVEIFHKAVDWALRHDEFFDLKEVAVAKKLLAIGQQRAAELREGRPSWNAATGLVVRAYRSKIDGSIQPYGMLVPEDWKPDDKQRRRLDFWCHGRGEKLSELAFVNERLNSKGEFQPPGAFVLFLYGRYCNANKFAGEVDLFEALADAKKHYAIDDTRLVMRGFSMGGAAAWQFGTHFAGMFAAVAPGAGFAESKEFLKLGTPNKPLPPEWEQKLWRWYDSTGYVANLANTTTVAYSGELDGQKQAADIMLRHAEPEGVKIEHIIGPQIGHKYHEESKPKINALLDAAVAEGAGNLLGEVRFVTYSLVYPEMKRLRIERLEKHWERAELTWRIDSDGALHLKTQNIARFSFNWADLEALRPISYRIRPQAIIDGQEQGYSQDDVPVFSRVKKDGRWTKPTAPDPSIIEKRPGICGPIDHAFMDSFAFVRPSGKPLNKVGGDWVESELSRAVSQWRQVFRGDARVVSDTAVSEDDITNSNLVLWGDPSSNAVLKRIVDQLPVKWDGKQLVFAGQTYDAAHTAPILIFPNPVNPQRYVVLNSSFTFREAAALNNAQQTPKLPDWAIVDLRTPPDAYHPGRIVTAGFFDEQWRAPEPAGAAAHNNLDSNLNYSSPPRHDGTRRH